MAGSFSGVTSATWSTSGTGTFNNNNPTAVYTPSAADITGGSVTLTYTTADPDGTGPCSAVSDFMVLTINPPATVNAGSDQTICSGSTVTMSGSFGGGATSATWTSSGTGSFSNNSPTAIYTPSQADISAGTVTIRYTTDDPAGVCTSVYEEMVVTINPAPTVTITSDLAMCSIVPISLSGSIGGGATSASWSGGTGTFNPNPNSLSVTYAPSAAEIAARTVTLTLATNDPTGPCPSASASRTITISRPVVITSQPYNVGVCVSYPATLSVVATGDDLTYQWYRGTSPGGTPVTNTSNISGATTALLHFNQAALTDAGSYYVVVSGGAGCIPVPSSTVTLNVDEVITVDQQPISQTECSGEDVTFTIEARPAGQITFQWRRNGVDIPGATLPTFTINNIQTSDAGNYDVIISGMAGYYCSSAQSAIAVLTVNEETISLSSGPGTDNQTVCISTSLPNITYQIGGVATGATITGLPAGLSGNYNSTTRIYTISGTPTAAGTFNYTITTTGPCTHTSMGGTITVSPNSTISLSSGSANQTVCINDPVGNIVYTIGGSATNASVTGLPAGVTGNFSNGVFTISGTPTVSGGPFNFTVTTDGPCQESSLTGTITVNADATISLSSPAGSDNQTICEESSINNIVYQIGGGATGATVTGLPDGVTGNYNSGTGILTISGNPTISGQFSYTVTADGSCDDASLSGTVTVDLLSDGGNLSPVGQVVCHGTTPQSITWTGTGSEVLLGWQYSTNYGQSWINIPSTSNTITFSGPLTQTTLYRARVQSGICPPVYSEIAAVNVILPTNVTGTATPSTICECDSSTLAANADLPGNDYPGGFTGGGFDNSSLPGWEVDGSPQIPSAADNQTEGEWGRTNIVRTYGPITYYSTGIHYAVVNGDLTSVLESPEFSLFGVEYAELSWIQAFHLTEGASARIEISVGGTNFTLIEWEGPLDLGNPSGLSPQTPIPLTQWLGQSDLAYQVCL